MERLGVSTLCPNMAIYGESGEIPLSLKGIRLMLTYWYRITNLPNDTHSIENPGKFKRTTEFSIQSKFIDH